MTRAMKIATLKILPLLLLSLLAACGPKEIGLDSESTSSGETSVSVAEQMRYPLFGSGAKERMLYVNNKMDVMVERQNFMQSKLKAGQVPPESPNYRAKPKERSPFRD